MKKKSLLVLIVGLSCSSLAFAKGGAACKYSVYDESVFFVNVAPYSHDAKEQLENTAQLDSAVIYSNGHTQILAPTARIAHPPRNVLPPARMDGIKIEHTSIDGDRCAYDHQYEAFLTYVSSADPAKTCKIKLLGGSYIKNTYSAILKPIKASIVEKNGLPCEVRENIVYVGHRAK